MLSARAANSLLLLTQESRSQPGHPSGMGIAIWTSRGCGQEEMDASLGSFSLTFLLPSRSLSGCPGGRIGEQLEQQCPGSIPLTPSRPAPLPQPPQVALCEFMGRTFCLQSAVRRDIKRRRKSARGGLSKPRQMKTFYHNLDLFALV